MDSGGGGGGGGGGEGGGGGGGGGCLSSGGSSAPRGPLPSSAPPPVAARGAGAWPGRGMAFPGAARPSTSDDPTVGAAFPSELAGSAYELTGRHTFASAPSLGGSAGAGAGGGGGGAPLPGTAAAHYQGGESAHYQGGASNAAAARAHGSLAVGPTWWCSPRHRMPLDSIIEGSKCVSWSMTRRTLIPKP